MHAPGPTIKFGTDGQNLVSCDLTATDILGNPEDPKQKCREKYGDNVVVHVPIPAEAISCTPPADSLLTDTCGEQPWVITGQAHSSAAAE